jgi:hypothetical protein
VRGVPAGYSRKQGSAEFFGFALCRVRPEKGRTRLGDYAVTERTLQVCLGGGPGTGANSRSLNRHLLLFSEPKPRELPLSASYLRLRKQGERKDETIPSQVPQRLLVASVFGRYGSHTCSSRSRSRSRRQFSVGERRQRARDGFHQHHRARTVARRDRRIRSDVRFRSMTIRPSSGPSARPLNVTTPRPTPTIDSEHRYRHSTGSSRPERSARSTFQWR